MNSRIRAGGSRVGMRALIALVLAAWAAMPALAAEQGAGAVTGTVLDESGKGISGARVSVKTADGTLRERTTTDAVGEFSIPGLIPGKYTIDVEKGLFETEHVSVDTATSASPIRVTLKIAAVSASIDVVAPKVDERPTGQLATVIDESIVRNVTGFSVAELVTFSPGVSIQQGNGPRDVVISIRGSNTRSTFGIRGVQVFDDGFSVTQPDGLSRSDLMDPHAYGAVDVERGPSSSLYGNYAVEGAINFHTRRPEEIHGFEGGVDVGSFGYRNAYLTYGHKEEKFEILAFGSEVVGKGFTTHNSFNTTTADVLATFSPSPKDRFTFKFIDNEMYPNLSIRLSLSQFAQNPYQKGCADLSAAGCASVSVFVNGSAGAKVNLSADQAGLQRHDRRTIIGTRWEHAINDRTTWRTQLIFDDKDIKQPTGATGGNGSTPSFNLMSDITQRGTLFGRSAVHFIGLFGNFENTNSVNYNITPGGDATLGAVTSAAYGHDANIGLRARDEVSLTPKITATLGVGIERSELQGQNTAYTYSAMAAPTLARSAAVRHFVNVAPEATFVFRPSDAVRAQARVGTGYGTPQASNLFVTPAGVSGNNTDLKSQTNIGIDTGVDVSKGFLTASLAGYYEWYRNELLSQSPGVNLLSYTFNAPRSIHKGIESTMELRVPRQAVPGLRLRTSYTLMNEFYDQYVERLSAGSFSQAFDRSGLKIPGIPSQSLTARLAYDRPAGVLAGLGTHVEYMFRNKFWLDNANLIQAPGYATININIHYDGLKHGRDSRGYHLLFDIRNVTNRVWVSSAANLSDTLNSSTGVQNGASVLATAGSIYTGSPRSFVLSLRHGF